MIFALLMKSSSKRLSTQSTANGLDKPHALHVMICPEKQSVGKTTKLGGEVPSKRACDLE